MLTEKQKRFCDEYLVDLNATRAYKAVYRNVKKDTVAATNGGRLLRKAEVKAYINEHLKEIHDERTADAQEVMEYLTSVLRGESRSETVVIEGTGEGHSEARAMVRGPDEKERLKAAELLGKRYSLYTDKVEADVDTELNIQIDYGDDDD